MNTAALKPIAIGSALVIGLVGTGLWIGSSLTAPATPPVAATDLPQSSTDTDGDSEKGADDGAHDDVVIPDSIAASAAEQDLLIFLVEEEKLAYDVYTTLGNLWGSRVFENITRSEASHQDRVAALLAAAGLDDPRSTEVGAFQNDELQALYDRLITQGSESETAAFEVGVAIEELDIADITEMLPTVDDPAIVSVLEMLRAASERHLEAFTRQLN